MSNIIINFMYVFCILNLGHTVIAEIVVADHYMHLLPGMILLNLVVPFHTKGTV